MSSYYSNVFTVAERQRIVGFWARQHHQSELSGIRIFWQVSVALNSYGAGENRLQCHLAPPPLKTSVMLRIYKYAHFPSGSDDPQPYFLRRTICYKQIHQRLILFLVTCFHNGDSFTTKEC